jgi:dTDP-4-dehydrorhamnose reductase
MKKSAVMSATVPTFSSSTLQLWGGVEGTVNRVGDQYFSQLEQNGHAGRLGDLEHFASLGIRALRYPILWERTAPDGPASADWSWPDARLAELQGLGIRPIVGLTHHGSGPRHTNLIDPGFPAKLAEYAGALARRYPWIEDYTPVNEPLTTARFSGLYGLWYPHGCDDHTFLRALLNQCRGVVLAMRAIRAVNARARLIQTEDLGKTYGTAAMGEQVAFYNARRWLSWDLLCGRVDADHELWRYLTENGIDAGELAWFRENRCPPDVIGINHYVTSERWLDHRIARYPGLPASEGYVDVEAVRVMATPSPGIRALLGEAWQRYGLPLAVTEAHIDANREDQLRWLEQSWRAAGEARADGVDVCAVTVWALLGAFDWNSLVTRQHGYYESGAFDVRSGRLRPTALVAMMRELSRGNAPSHPVLSGPGWWHRPERLLYPPAGSGSGSGPGPTPSPVAPRPIMIVGADADAALGDALVRACAARGLACHRAGPAQLDASDGAALDAAISRHRPWALIHAAMPPGCRNGGAAGAKGSAAAESKSGTVVPEAVLLAVACARNGLGLLCFSATGLCDGAGCMAVGQSDGSEIEARLTSICGDSFLVRSGDWFGVDEDRDFIERMHAALHGRGASGNDAGALRSPTYLPDLIDACLNLLIDGERGLWHLRHGSPISDTELALRACTIAGVPAPGLVPDRPGATAALQVAFAERGTLLPSLDDALRRSAIPASLRQRYRMP